MCHNDLGRATRSISLYRSGVHWSMMNLVIREVCTRSHPSLVLTSQVGMQATTSRIQLLLVLAGPPDPNAALNSRASYRSCNNRSSLLTEMRVHSTTRESRDLFVAPAQKIHVAHCSWAKEPITPWLTFAQQLIYPSLVLNRVVNVSVSRLPSPCLCFGSFSAGQGL